MEMSMAVIRSNGYNFKVKGARHQALKWIASHLPTEKESEGVKGHLTLDVVCDATGWSRIEKSVSETGDRVQYYQNLHYNIAADDGLTTYISWTQLGNPDHAVTVISPVEYRLIVREEDSLTDRLILRLLRMITRGSLLASGGLLVHSSAVVTQRGGVLLVARSGGGKTSSSVIGARDFDGALVSTDRTVISHLPDGSIAAHGGPEMHRLGLGFVRSVNMPEEVSAKLARRDIAPALTEEAPRFGGRSKLEFTFRDLGALGVRSVEGGRITAVAYIAVGDSARVKGMTSEQQALIFSEVLHPDPGLRFPWATGIKTSSEANDEMGRILESLELYSVEWNPDESQSLSRSMNELARQANLT
jgi:hypothetical protein